MQLFKARQTSIVEAAEALPGRSQPIQVAERHLVLGNPLRPPFPEGVEQAIFGMGCFWGAERIFWEAPGVYTTAVGYAGGITPNPTYEEVCSGRTGHAEVVLVAFDSRATDFENDAEAVLGGPRPDSGHEAGKRSGHPVSLAHHLLRRCPAEPRRIVARYLRADAPRPAVTARSQPKSWPQTRRGRSTTPRTTTSSTLRRTRAGTAAWVAQVWPVPSASPPAEP